MFILDHSTSAVSSTTSLGCRQTTSQKKILKDEDYLINRCLQYDWEEIERHCAFLCQVFRSSSVRKTYAYCGRQQLVATDQWGNTALHVACYHKPPKSTIHALLQATRLAPGDSCNIHLMPNLRNATPLSIACVNGASPEVLYELLHPPRGMIGSGSIVTVADDQGMTPFLGLMMRYEILRFIPFFKEKCRPLEEINELPELSTNLFDYNKDEIFLADLPEAIESEVESEAYFHHKTKFQTFWVTVETLIREAWKSSNVDKKKWFKTTTSHPELMLRNSSYISTVHGAANVCDCIPPKMTDLIFRIYQIFVSTTDETGTLPLHLAVATHSDRQHHGHQFNHHPKLLYNRKYFIDKLLEVDPSSACVPIPYHNGRLPFFQAIASGLLWHIGNDTTTSTNTNTNTKDKNELLRGPLQSIWKCAPEVILSRDPVTGLYPFMLAVSIQVQPMELSKKSTTDDVLQLDTVYNLLRINPQVVKEFCAD